MKLYQGKQIKLEAVRALEPHALGHPNLNMQPGHRHFNLDFKVHVTKHLSQPLKKKKKNLEKVPTECLALSNATSWYTFQRKPDVK